MLLMDGVRYVPHEYKDEAELESMVKEHHRYIFGEDSIIIDIKRKVKTGRVAAIPDYYSLTFNPDKWWVVEVERYTHDVHRHIVAQMSDFITGIRDSGSQRELTDAFYAVLDEEGKNKVLDHHTGTDLHYYLSQLLRESPEFLIIIDSKPPDLDRAIANLTPAPKVREFATFRRQGAEAVHVHQFEPLVENMNTYYKGERGEEETEPRFEELTEGQRYYRNEWLVLRKGKKHLLWEYVGTQPKSLKFEIQKGDEERPCQRRKYRDDAIADFEAFEAEPDD